MAKDSTDCEGARVGAWLKPRALSDDMASDKLDKETIYRHLNSRYCSKRDMIARIPLGIQPDAFWQDFLHRRRAQSVSLPLYNGNGNAYWYVTTEKMIDASEKIVKTLYEEGTEYDPYTEPPPVVTLEEAFFTSYVEGAQITMQAAMDFLYSGQPPRDIEEQMITNNRIAGRYSEENLHRRIDLEFLRDLAFYLTDGMDGGGSEFRTSNDVDYASPDDECFSFPSAASIPNSMEILCSFLASPLYHPLIKAGVAQGYMLLLRPFSEGNDRIGRILSNMILLRAGYTFFSDVSLSALIARRSYAYYEAIANILREENGGDQTYFLEFFLELLSRAVDERVLRRRRNDEQDMRTEAEMAYTALTAQPEPMPDSISEDPKSEPPQMPEEPEFPPAAIETADAEENDLPDGLFVRPTVEPDVRCEGIESQTTPNNMEWILESLRTCAESSGEHIKTCALLFLDYLDKGKLTFTQADIAAGCNLQPKQAANTILQFRLKGIIKSCRTWDGKLMLYGFNMTVPSQESRDAEPDVPEQSEEEDPLEGFFSVPVEEPGTIIDDDISLVRVQEMLIEYTLGSTDKMKRCAKLFLRFMANGKYRFTKADIAVGCNLTIKQASNLITHFLTKEIIESSYEKEGRLTLYHFNTNLPPLYAKDYSEEVLNAISELRKSERSPKDRRIGDILFAYLSKGMICAQNCERYGSPAKLNNDMLLPMRMGVVDKLGPGLYRINRQLSVQPSPLSGVQKAVLFGLYHRYRNNWFSRARVFKGMDLTEAQINGAIHQLSMLRIIESYFSDTRKYRLCVNPESRPDLFEGYSDTGVPEPLGEPGNEDEPYNLNRRVDAYADDYMSMIKSLAESDSTREKRLADYVMRHLKDGFIQKREYIGSGYTQKQWATDIALALSLGLVRKTTTGGVYVLNLMLQKPGWADHQPDVKLKPGLKKTVTEIYAAFGDQSFTSEMFIATLNYSQSHTYASLRDLRRLRIVEQRTIAPGCSQYQLLVNPEDNPECFDIVA